MDLDRWLFSYGTLRQAEVQRELFGRVVQSEADVLPGFRIETLRITDADVVALSGLAEHPVLRRGSPGDTVPGSALRVSEQDLARADAYEVSDYTRIGVTLGSGRRAYAYVHRDDAA